MIFTEHKFDPAWAMAETKRRAEAVKVNQGADDFKAFAVQVVLDRLAKGGKIRYRDYGPYWWALKDVLRRHGQDFGPQSDPIVMAEYQGEADSLTLTMADSFRTDYLKTQAVGTNRFMLDGETGEWWTLFDPDMESLE